jgi:Protein of unknown function (DUF642)
MAFLVLAAVLISHHWQKPRPQSRFTRTGQGARPAGPAGNGGFAWDGRGNLIVNGSFEQPVVPPMQKGETPKVLWMNASADEMKPWETDLSEFEIWANGIQMPRGSATVRITPAKSAVGNQNIEIISDPAMAGAVWQTVKTKPGTSYEFSFYHSERPGAKTTLTVSLNDKAIATIEEDGTPYGTLFWELFETNFVADSATTTVKFSDESDVLGQGTHLDGVLLREE